MMIKAVSKPLQEAERPYSGSKAEGLPVSKGLAHDSIAVLAGPGDLKQCLESFLLTAEGIDAA